MTEERTGVKRIDGLATIRPQVTELLPHPLFTLHLPLEIMPGARQIVSGSIKAVDQAEIATASGRASYCMLARINM